MTNTMSRRCLASMGMAMVSHAWAGDSDSTNVKIVGKRVREFVEALQRRDRRGALNLFRQSAISSPLMYRDACTSFGAYEFYKASKDRRIAIIAALDWYVREIGGKAMVYAKDAPLIEDGITALNDTKADGFLIFRGSDISMKITSNQDDSGDVRALVAQPRTYVSILPFTIGACFLVWQPSTRGRWEIVYAQTFCE